MFYFFRQSFLYKSLYVSRFHCCHPITKNLENKDKDVNTELCLSFSFFQNSSDKFKI